VLHPEISNDLHYPTSSDQDGYVENACNVAMRFSLSQKVPLYSIWLGILCSAEPDPQQCLIREKLISLLLLSVLCGLLGAGLFGQRAGLLFAFWTLNAKYLAIEPNGSNSLAAALLAASLLCLMLPRPGLRLPCAMLLLFLSSLARPEMRIPLLAVLLFVSARGFWRLRRAASTGGGGFFGEPWAWAVVAALALGTQLLVETHESSGREAKWSVSNAFVLGFGVTYIEREGLSKEFPDPWHAACGVVGYIMPGVETPWGALRQYPRTLLAHVRYNVGKSFKVLPSLLFGFSSRRLQVVVLLSLLAEFLWRRVRGQPTGAGTALDSDQREALALWSVAACLLIPMACVFVILWRYFLPLLPVGLIGLALLWRWGVDFVDSIAARRAGNVEGT
jgi:hypothetical protein